MNNHLLFLNKEHKDTSIEQTRTKPQQTFELKMNRQMQTFSFSPPTNLVEERKWLLAVLSFEATNSVFKITDENNSFSISIPGWWRIPTSLPAGINDKLTDLLKLRSENDIELHVEEVKKRRNQILMEDKKI